MITLTQEKLANAIQRAKRIRPRVTWLGSRSFQVTGSQRDLYTVHFAVARDANGKQVCLGVCDCEAGKNEMACFHLAAASAVNIAIHAMRRACQITNTTRTRTHPSACRSTRICVRSARRAKSARMKRASSTTTATMQCFVWRVSTGAS